MSNLGNRVLVAALLAPIALAAAYGGGVWLVLFCVVAAFAALDELCRMLREYAPVTLAAMLGAVLFVVCAHWKGPDGLLIPLPALLFSSFVLSIAVARRERPTVSLAITVFAAVYVGFGLASLVLLRDLGTHTVGFNLLLACLLGTWASDIAAYFGGRAFGRRKLAPAISPGKTVEGFWFGLVAGTATVWFTLYDQVHSLGNGRSVVVGFAVALASPLGDLFESFLKRDLGVKDSGTLLGGHGGVLDRIDALLFAGPAMLAALTILS
jgi:phosphatidate cytidylyltransferase